MDGLGPRSHFLEELLHGNHLRAADVFERRASVSVQGGQGRHVELTVRCCPFLCPSELTSMSSIRPTPLFVQLIFLLIDLGLTSAGASKPPTSPHLHSQQPRRRNCALWPWLLRRGNCSFSSAVEDTHQHRSRLLPGSSALNSALSDTATQCPPLLTCSRMSPSSNSPLPHSRTFHSPPTFSPSALLSALSSGEPIPLPARDCSHRSTSSPTWRFSLSVRCSLRSAWYESMTDVVAMTEAKAVSANA